MACIPTAALAVGVASMLLGCSAVPPVPPGSMAEAQLHAPCPAQGGCVESLACVGGEEELATCELTCSGSCPWPLQCMPRPDGQRGGVCLAPPERPRGWGN